MTAITVPRPDVTPDEVIQVTTPPTLPVIWLINTLGTTRKVGRVLRSAPGLGRPTADATAR